MMLEKIKTVLSAKLSEHIAPAQLKELRIFEESDADGDPILRVQVILDKSGPKIAADKILFATGIARAALSELKDSRFPLLTFPGSDELPEVAA